MTSEIIKHGHSQAACLSRCVDLYALKLEAISAFAVADISVRINDLLAYGSKHYGLTMQDVTHLYNRRRR